MAQPVQPNRRSTLVSAGKLLLACGAFATVHSAFASKAVKRAVERRAGQRVYRGLYRLGFVAQTGAMLGLGAAWYLRLPNRELYHVRGPAALLMRGVQGASLVVAAEWLREMGAARFMGLSQGAALMRGEMPPTTPEAQGPVPLPNGAIDQRGLFSLVRHPYNPPVLGLLWLTPRMTVNRLVLAAAFSAYIIIGSLHEEARLREQFGEDYDRYAERVPFMAPTLAGNTPLVEETNA